MERHTPPAAVQDSRRHAHPRHIQRQSSQFTTTLSLNRPAYRPAPAQSEHQVGRKLYVNPLPSDAHQNYDVPDFSYLYNEFLIPGGGFLQFVLFPLWIVNCFLVAIPGIIRWRARRGRFIDNSIRTSRYNLLDFVPKQLLFQFSKIANLYFLLISMLQLVPNWSPTGQFTTIFPLTVFVVVAMLRELWDDLVRHRADAKENSEHVTRLKIDRTHSSNELAYLNNQQQHQTVESPQLEQIEYNSNLTYTLNDGTPVVWETTQSRHLKVGDLVLIRNHDMIPADILVLASTNPNGTCFIETANLDGETNLKQKQAVKVTSDAITDVKSLASFYAVIKAESPTDNLYGFDGYLEVGKSGDRVPLTPSQLLLRGSTLRNTHHVFGVVVYTGEDTKIRMNANDPRSKASTLEKLTNRVVIFMFTFVVVISALLTGGAVVWESTILKNGTTHWYLEPVDVPADYAATFFSFVILFNAMVPISLYVTMEFVKVYQILFMMYDRGMYDEKTDTPAQARTSSLNEELGQVQYVFSDKTGTLTENLMVFRKLSVAGTSYFHNSKLHPPPSVDPSKLYIQSNDTPLPAEQLLKSIQSGLASSRHRDPITGLTIQTRQQTHLTNEIIVEKAYRFLEAMALCHTIVPDRSALVKKKQEHKVSDISALTDSGFENEIIYQSSSPDEVALSDAARELSFILHDRNTVSVTISAFGELKQYKVLQTLEFNSTRKRMSVVMQFPDGRIVLLCKGADSIILERTRKLETLPRYEAEFMKKMNDHLRDFATEGLRTLLYAYREFEASEYEGWSRRYLEASTALENRAEKMDRVAAEVEKDLILLGATAIEDKLQEGVPETIDALRRAGIKIWMLTGDKKETAVNIGYTCQIIKEWSQVIFVEGHNAAEIARSLEMGIELASDVQAGKKRRYDVQPDKGPESAAAEGKQPHVVLVCEGETLLRMEEQHVNYLENIGSGYPQAAPSKPLVLNSHRFQEPKNRWDEQPQRIAPPHVDDAPKDYSVLLRFLDLGIRCDSVVCCRFSPAQKALIVSQVKSRVVEDDDRLSQDVARKPSGHTTGAAALKVDGTGTPMVQRSKIGRFFRDFTRMSFPSCVTLAIGDGANDIPMIQAAHVGIGITGREGLAAARASDYSIAQFRFLQPLLFVHGRWSYVRISMFTLGTFYKCVVYYSNQGLFQMWTGFSGASLYEQWTLSLYNILFSSLPVLAVGVFERDLSRAVLMAVPELYRYGQLNHGFNFILFFKWVVTGLFHAGVSIIIPFIMYNGFRSGGPGGGLVGTQSKFDYAKWVIGDMTGVLEENFIYGISTLVYAVVVFIVTIKIAYLESRYITRFHHFAVALTLIAWFIYPEIYNILYPRAGSIGVESAGMQHMFRGYFWIVYIPTICLGTFVALGLCDFLAKAVTRFWSDGNPIKNQASQLTEPNYKERDARDVTTMIQHLQQEEKREDSEARKTTAYSVAMSAAADCAGWWNLNGPPSAYEWGSRKAVAWWQMWEYAYGVVSDLDSNVPILKGRIGGGVTPKSSKSSEN